MDTGVLAVTAIRPPTESDDWDRDWAQCWGSICLPKKSFLNCRELGDWDQLFSIITDL